MATWKMKLAYFLIVLLLIPIASASAQFYHDFPPTSAFKFIFANSGNITAKNYTSKVTFVGSNLIITPNYATNTITFTGTASKGNGTVDSLTCSLGQFFNSYNNATHMFTCLSPNPAGATLDTIQNLTPAQAYVYAKNSSNTNFQFRGINGTGGATVSNTSSTIIIHSNIYQNNTGSNLGTSGTGVFSSMLGSVLQFFKVISANNLLSISSNSTNVIFTIQHVITDVFKANNLSCSNKAFTSFSNSTGLFSCSTFFNAFQNIGKGTGSFGFLTSSNNIIQSKNLTVSNPLVLSSNGTDNILTCPTCGTSSQNTAQGNNLTSTNGAGIGVFENRKNATMLNFRTLTSLNSFVNYQRNTTNIGINASVPSSNVMDIYDQTISDYSTPTGSANSTEKESTIDDCSSHTTLGTGTLFTSQKLTGLSKGLTYYAEGINVFAAANNVRLKVYQDDGAGGGPSTLLAQTGSTAVSATGWLDIALTSSFTVPASGNVWLAVETDGATFSTCYTSVGAGSAKTVAHTYGTGPSPFGAIGAGTVAPYMRLGFPSLLAIDGSTSTKWVSKSEVNPWVYVDTGSAQILTSVAIYPDKTNTTSTQILVQTSTDASTWNTKRTVNISLLTDASWNFIRWDLDTSTERYVRIFGNDGSSKVLAIWEIKVLIPTSTNLLMRHGHEFIDSTNATLPLNR